MFALSAARQKLGMTQRRLSELSGVSKGTIQRMEDCFPDGDPGVFGYNGVKAVCRVLTDDHPFFRRDFVEEFYTEYDSTEMILNWMDRIK